MGRRFLPHALVGAFFLAATAVIHHEVLADLSGRVLGGRQCGGFYSWLFWWWDFALHQGLPLFHTRWLMFPDGVPVFPYCPVNELPALLIQQVSTPWAAVNLMLLAGYAFTGFTAWLLFSKRTGDGWAALFGAFAYAFSAYAIVQHFHGQLSDATLYFNPLLALAVLGFFERPGRAAAVWVAAALCGVVLSGPYVAFAFGGVFLAGAAVFDLAWGRRALARAETLKTALVAVGAAALVALIAYWPLLRWSGRLIGARVFYTESLASFIDPPFWNRSLQAVRPLAGGRVMPEEAMAWLGLATIVLIGWGLSDRRLRRDPEFRFWGWILGVSAVLCLGPTLKLSPGTDTGVPLPYWLVLKLPVLSNFRNTGRILMTVTLAACALAVMALARLQAGRKTAFRAALCAGLILLTAWEFDLPRIGGAWAAATPGAAYRRMAEDPEPGAVLELPLSYDERGNLMLHAQYYMMFQPYHRRPMVLGYPSRHLVESLAFTENTEVVYEFTHPDVLKRLDTDRGLADRAARLKKEASRRLREAGIRYVLFHPDVPGFDPDTGARLKAWLTASLGEPLVTGEDGASLFLLVQSSSHEARPGLRR